jgi:hypothetical protein
MGKGRSASTKTVDSSDSKSTLVSPIISYK